MTIFTNPFAANHVANTERIKASYLNAIETAINEIAAAVAPLLQSSPGPSTPVVLSVTPGVGFVTLSWTSTTGGTGFSVQRSGVDAFGNAGSPVSLPVTATSYKFDNLTPGTVYTFTFQVLPSGVVQSITGTPTAPTPTAQTVVTVDTVGDGRATVRWTPVAGATGYLVGRDGPDAVGGGTGWSTTDPSTATSREFLSLVNGTLYTFYVEPQPSVANGGNFVRQSKTATPVAAATPAGQTTVTLTNITGSTITMNWTAVSGATSYAVGRVNLNNAADVYETTDPATATSRVFDNLTSGVPYSCYVTPLPGGTKVAKTGTPTGTVVVTPPPPSGTGTAWLSGVSNIDQSRKNEFGTWRGEPVTCNRFWLSGPNQLQAGYWINVNCTQTGFTGVLDYAIGAPPAAGVSWASAASGGYDSQWRTQMQGIHANWGGLRAVYLAMAHELNGDWYDWRVLDATTASYFKQAWVRYYNIVQQELVQKGRAVKVCLNYALGRGNMDLMYPGNAYVDIIGGDHYDHWLPTSSGHIQSDADWNTTSNNFLSDGSPRGAQALSTWAAAKGKPIAFPEWGLSDTTKWTEDPPYDNPLWIQKMHDFFASIAPADPYNAGPGKLAFENIFSSSGGDSYHLSIWPATSQNPLASAKYQSLKWGQV